MSSNPLTQTIEIYLEIPKTDWNLFSELVKRFGWKFETKDEFLRRGVTVTRRNLYEVGYEDAEPIMPPFDTII